MKKSELRNIIREVVRDELAYAMRELFKLDESKPNKVSNKKQKKTYSTNPVLNEILNDTEGGIPQGGDSYQTMGNKTFTSDNMGELVNRKFSRHMNAGEIDGDSMVASMGVDPNSVDDNIKNVIGKDYRSFMKKVDKVNNTRKG